MKEKILEKLTAKRLYVNQFYTIVDAAKKVGVTEKTLAKWVKKNNWKQEQEEMAEKLLGDDKKLLYSPILIIEDLKAYIEENSPVLAKKLIPIINNYLKTTSIS